MKNLLLFASVIFSSASVLAAPISSSNVTCTAKYFEVLPDGSAKRAESVLKVLEESSAHLLLETELEGRGYVFNGPKSDGPYLVTISKAPDYTTGSNATTEFSEQGRLQISVVEGPIVHKLECYRK